MMQQGQDTMHYCGMGCWNIRRCQPHNLDLGVTRHNTDGLKKRSTDKMAFFAYVLDSLASNPTASLVILLILLMTWWYMKPSPYKFPPGRPCLPIFGNFSLFDLNADLPEMFLQISREYNSSAVVSWVFSFCTVIVNKYEDARELFMSDIFMNKIESSASKHVFRGIVGAQGDRHKEQRRFTLSTLRDFGLGKNKVVEKIHEELEKLVEELENTNDLSIEMNCSSIFNTAVANIICSMVFGHRFEYNDPTFKRMSSLNNENITTNIRRVYLKMAVPFADYIPGDLFREKRLQKCVDEVKQNVLIPEFRRHFENYNPDHIGDYMDAFIKEMKDREGSDKEHWFTEEQLMWNIEDLFIAGTETTTTFLGWSFLMMLHYPDVQKRVQQEIHDIVGTDRLPSMTDKVNLPYTEATLLEIQRRCPVVPLLGHCSITPDKPSTFQEYILPPNTNWVVNFHAVHHDPDYWQDPYTFNPERFIGEDGKFKKDDHVMTFSVGKRSCLGESLAKAEMFLFFSTVLQRFSLQTEHNQPPPKIVKMPGLTSSPKPYKFCFVKL
ncbi:unnamed protein product [Owenia fusiformis]|uniref:Cytochrome P450 n=1 Tax=Owenia fusiformis TaxID=6347 RepID=A0A8S4N4H2_OWEFU|nr:unnamed protein product [Owenia fusiformis]